MLKKLITTLLIAFLLQGCATPFARFYYDRTGSVDLTKVPSVVLPTGEPHVYRGNGPEQDALKMFEDNYNLVGYSSFNAGNVDENGAITQTKKDHATVVILYSKYTGTITGSIPLTLPNTRTSSTSLYGNAYGSGNVIQNNMTYRLSYIK